MEILGIGLDVVEVRRIAELYSRHGQRFLARVFAPEEQEYCLRMKDPSPCLAARFAAKEAVSKAFGTGIGPDATFTEIVVQREASGRPTIVLHGAAAETARRLGIERFLVSLTHTEHYAAAQAIALPTGEEKR